jgi:hypothetical protein
MGIAGELAKSLGPRLAKSAPALSTNFVHTALRRAIDGVGPLPAASVGADMILAKKHGDVKRAVHEMIEDHVRYAAGQGFVTNIGGLVTAAFAIPANIAGLALLQCRLVASIAHLRGYDLTNQRVRNAILTCLLGEDDVTRLVKNRRLPSTPMGIATAPTHDPHADTVIAAEVTSALLSKMAGKRVATVVGRRIPLVGGVFGASSDAYTTWQIGRYADRELRPRRLR